MATTEALERNLARYAWHHMAKSALFWLPVSGLLFWSRFGLSGALQLQAIYFAAVVIAEVPSGWFSDRVGRVTTLRISACAWMTAAVLVIVAGDWFALYALSEVFIAIGFAFLSGTDVALHYDSVEALGRSDEFEARESRVARIGLFAMAAAVLSGGLLGSIDLRLPFVASALAALALLWILRGMTEPPQQSTSASLTRQIGDCLQHLRRPLLAWLFGYIVAQLVLEHLSTNLAQPYFIEALGESADTITNAPILSGVVLAATAFVAAVAVGWSSALRVRFGLVPVLLALAALQVLIVGAMALVVHVAVSGFLVFRSLQTAIAPVLVTAAVAPVVPSHQRATYLSLNSLAGRLCHSIVLLGLSGIGDDTSVLPTARVAAFVAAAIFGVVMLSAPLARRGGSGLETGGADIG